MLTHLRQPAGAGRTALWRCRRHRQTADNTQTGALRRAERYAGTRARKLAVKEAVAAG
jgi:hypothetical protein